MIPRKISRRIVYDRLAWVERMIKRRLERNPALVSDDL